MSNVVLSFDAKNDSGNNLGDYEMFVDLTSSVQDPSTIELSAPQGHTILGIKLYPVTEVNGKVTRNQEKTSDITLCKRGNWTEVFDNVTYPAGFSYNSTTHTLTDSGAATGAFEYLIWLDSTTSPGSYDYVDPGIRNH